MKNKENLDCTTLYWRKQVKKERAFKRVVLSELAKQISLKEFKQIVLGGLKWYGIPKEWKMTDVETFYYAARQQGI